MTRDEGFVAFYREYTQTWLHAVATASLTAFGMLTFVNRLFAVVAIAAYVLPPVVQYVRGSSDAAAPDDAAGDESGTTAPDTDDPAVDDRDEPRETGAGDRHESDDGAADQRHEANEDADADADQRHETSEEVDGGGHETDGDSDDEPRWTAVDVPTDATLVDVAVSDGEAHAVGSGGVVVGREGDGEWTVLLDDGPGAAGNDLRGVAAAGSDGVWVAGDGGAVGRIDPDTGRHTDYSAPDGDTSNISAVAAAADGGSGGDGGTETVLLADGSGRVRRGRYRDGELAWEDPVKPGSGSSVAAAELRDDDGAVCDTAGGVFRTDDGGRTFDSLGFDADGTPTDVTGGDAPLVATDGGAVHRSDGSRWTPDCVADEALPALAADGENAVAVGESETYQRFGSTEWSRATTPALGSLRGVAVDGERAVAVGDDGTAVERS